MGMNMTSQNKIMRAPFSEELTALRKQLSEFIPLLESEPQWYGSIYFERKRSRVYSSNQKQNQATDQLNMGLVLRIYDGHTLFEEATDDLDLHHLKSFISAFIQRVKASAPPQGVSPRTYRVPNWKEKLSLKLDPEIRSQIPESVSPGTEVHFGIRYEQDPLRLSTEGHFLRLAEIISQIKKKAKQVGLAQEALSFINVRQSIAVEDSFFLDRETNISQTLYRVALTLMTMCGAERTFLRVGGLGGMETVHLTDPELTQLLSDLKALTQAERLVPGKYRVIFGPVVTGVLAHEAFGHSQEGDTCARGRSKAWELHHEGARVGNEHATILNNPAIFQNAGATYAAWGSYFFDEEGWLAQEQVLLDQGKLLAPMTNLTSAIRLNIPRTANGKRESWSSGVYTRQTNTYFSAGDKTLDELMELLGDGYLATQPAGGMEDPKGMGIQVGISYLYEVRNGKLTGKVLKGPAGGDIQMTGYTPDVLNAIIAKSKIDVNTDTPDQSRFPYNDVGGCGKYHKEFVFAGCGGPYILLDPVILG
ncbi:TldD/PmbA family protein [bacterium]|nr:TldD/PmbA family protein [bacterium]